MRRSFETKNLIQVDYHKKYCVIIHTNWFPNFIIMLTGKDTGYINNLIK